ncbi:methyl-accepting chemotaxis protein [Geothrix alkalitolerans]|uniref:methyl-accepting chemotaxis protein n=1 Tax=Geothrix alkalitolerans TaxID=2922724 RepID=UPI001FAFDE87|nr:methyl-accepting chemotaxis protein [Geothrix alkalitolerans]
MFSVQNLKIKTQMFLGGGVVSVMLLMLAWVGNSSVDQISRGANTTFTYDYALAELFMDMGRNAVLMRRWEKDVFLNFDDKARRDEYARKWKETQAALVETVDRAEKVSTASEDRDAIRSIRLDITSYGSEFEKLIPQIDMGLFKTSQELNKAADPYREASRRLEAASEKAVIRHEKEMHENIRQMQDTSLRMTRLMLGITLVSLIAAMAIVWRISMRLSRGVSIVADAIGKMADGDLRNSVEVSGAEELKEMGAAYNRMVENLSQTIGEVRTGANALASAAQQVSSTSQGLSQGTSEQASSVEETTASLEELSSSIEQNADNSRQTEQMAMQSARDADESGQSVEKTVEAMKMIAERISIIEEIAYQTNLLALNAAIEAARAGEHGRGFAVVATEVRKLAERSQGAAKEINEVAGGSVGVAIKSGEQLKELVPAIRKTAELVQEVAATSREQASGVKQMNKAMTQVDQVTQRNASAAEELSSTAEELASQAEALQQLVAFFKVTGDEAVARHAPAAPFMRPEPAPLAGRAMKPAVGLDQDQHFKRF